MDGKYKFRRYKICYRGKTYYIYIPFGYSELFFCDWADEWYLGMFLNGQIRGIKYLLASFSLIAFNPYAIILLPITKNKKIPNTFMYGDNCAYDIIFKSTKVSIKDKEIKAIIKNLKYYKWTTYKMVVDIKRMEKYFGNNVNRIRNIPCKKILKNADGYINNGIIHYSFPQIWYQLSSIDLIKYFTKNVFHRKSFSECYYKEYDYFQLPCRSFVYDGKMRKKYSYQKPSLTFYVELYDINILNKYVKHKIYLVDRKK